MPKKVTAKLAKNFGGKTNHWKMKDLSRTLQPCFTTWHDLFWGMHMRSEISPVSSCLVHEEKLSPFDMFHKLKYIEQCNFVVSFIQWKDDGWLWRGGCNGGLDSEVYLFILNSCQLEAVVGSNIEQCNFVVSFIQRKHNGWLWRGGGQWRSWLRSIPFYTRQLPVGGGGGV